MAKKGIPNPLERRHLVERDLPAERARGIAEAYLAAGRIDEAIDFLAIARDTERLGELRVEAVSSGDAFRLRSVTHALGVAPEREEWSRLAEAARSLGKQRYAEEAERQAERGED